MSDWSAGYVSELGYTYGYYEELNPNHIDLCLLSKGLQPPTITHALELGFGQGVSINIHAAASDVTWAGTDFNPSQASFARQLAGQSGAKANLLDASFQEFLANDDTPSTNSLAYTESGLGSLTPTDRPSSTLFALNLQSEVSST